MVLLLSQLLLPLQDEYQLVSGATFERDRENLEAEVALERGEEFSPS